MKHMFFWALGMLLAPLAMAQCDADHTVNVQSFSYTPADLVINQGESVAFINFGGSHDVNGIASTITGDNFGNPEEFFLPTVMGTASGVCMGTVTFDVPGTYNYDCSVGQHALNGMVASITVNPVAVSATVVDIIVDSPDHTLLEAAVVAAGLVDALSGEGPFTVFAPTDAAITALTAALGITAEDLLALPTLGDILTYHVVAGLAMSTDLSDGQMITTLLGEDVTISITAEGVFVNDAQVTVADIEADNGVVHVIDAVLLPPTDDIQEVNVAWTLAPNPAQGQVRLMNIPSTAVVMVRDMTGRVLTTLPQGAQTLDVQGWTSGVYFVEWSLGSVHTTQKLVVE
jgi:uncharacterized surface protein with fasciclin (FAS1) repeats